VVGVHSDLRAVRKMVTQLPVEKCEQLYVDAQCHREALHLISAFLTFCPEWP
jgi:hypothetical protein